MSHEEKTKHEIHINTSTNSYGCTVTFPLPRLTFAREISGGDHRQRVLLSVGHNTVKSVGRSVGTYIR